MWLRTGARYLRGVLQALRSRVGGRGVAPDSKPSPEPYLPPSPSLSASAPDVLDGTRIASELEETLRKCFAEAPTYDSIGHSSIRSPWAWNSASAVAVRQHAQSSKVHKAMMQVFNAQVAAYTAQAMAAAPTFGIVVEEVSTMQVWKKGPDGIWHNLLANPQWCRTDVPKDHEVFFGDVPVGEMCPDCKAYYTSRVVES